MRISTSLLNQRGLEGILEQQARLSRIQSQIASNKRINSPSDDPSGSAQILRLSQTIAVTEQYIRNSDAALNRLRLEENALSGVEAALLNVRELAVQASNGVLTDQDRQAIADEVRQYLAELVGLANSKDANQEYLFSGNQVHKQTISQVNGSFIYNGDQGQRTIQVSSGLRIADSDTGSAVFMDIINGNGSFTTQDNPANTGTGIIDTGQVFDQGAYVEDTYTINFVTNANGNLAYNVIGAASGQLIPPLPQDPTLDAPDYVSEQSIRFNGIETKISALPVTGDSFTVQPSVKQDMFTSVANLASALESDTFDAVDRAKVLNQVSRSFVDIDRAFDNVLERRSSIGARLNIIESKTATNESFVLELKTTLSSVQDLDIASAAVELQQRLTSLEAAQASFVRIQGLSLFDVL